MPTVADLIQPVWESIFFFSVALAVGGALPCIMTGIYFLVREAID